MLDATPTTSQQVRLLMAAAVLGACQQRTDLLAGFFASTGMTLDPEPP